MKIAKIIGREMYDARGFPTVECELILEDGISVYASVPTGTSTATHEAFDLRDDGKRLMGYGVQKAIEGIENDIAPLLIGQEPDLISADLAMIELDGTPEKSRLGGNAILAVSIAVLRAQAAVENINPYELIAYLCDYSSVTLPFAMFNMISGGAHARNNINIQEIMAMPVGPQSFRGCVEAAVMLHYALGQLLYEKNKTFSIGMEGAYVANFTDEEEACDMLMMAIEKAEDITGSKFLLSLDMAASQFYDRSKGLYNWHGKKVSSDDLISYYDTLAQRYPLFSIEDGMSEFDFNGWSAMTNALHEKMQVLADDLTCTNPHKIADALEQGLSTGVIIKPNQIGTVTETLQAIKLAKEHEMTTVVSHRSHETNDSFIVDLVVGTSAGYIKAGGPARGEHLVKYNELLRIEDMLMFSLLDS